MQRGYLATYLYTNFTCIIFAHIKHYHRYIGIGLGCTSSAKCDMIVGNGGGSNPVSIGDFFEEHGDRLPFTDVEMGGTDDVKLLAASYR